MEFKEAIKLAEDIIERFRKVEGKPWNAEASVIELTKQIGHLANEIMKTEKYYPKSMQTNNSKEKMEDELGDILFGIMRIANHYNIDLERAHIEQIKTTDKFLKGLGA